MHQVLVSFSLPAARVASGIWKDHLIVSNTNSIIVIVSIILIVITISITINITIIIIIMFI